MRQNAAVRRHMPLEARLASNPVLFADMTPWPVNISWALLADRRSCFAGNELAIAFAPLTPDQRAAIEAEIGRLGLQELVTMLGYVDDDDVPDLYRWADVFAHPHTNEGEGNDFEGFGIVIADAMHFGCVAISGRAGGPSELIQDGTDGYLVDGSRVDDIVTAFERLIAEPRLVEQIGSAASATA